LPGRCGAGLLLKSGPTHRPERPIGVLPSNSTTR
jgi:hypothetical protein